MTVHWHMYQNRWWHVRLFFTLFKRSWNLEMLLKPSCGLRLTYGGACDDDRSCCLYLGLLFISVYIVFPWPEKLLFTYRYKDTYLVQGREYGFYFFNWCFKWDWHRKTHELSSSDPWWMSQFYNLAFWRK